MKIMIPETQLYYQIQNKEISKQEAIANMKFWKDRGNDFSYDYSESYLKDHKVFEKHVLLGVTHPSIMIDYLFSIYPMNDVCSLTNISFIEPVVIEPNESVKVKILSTPLDNKLEAIYTSESDQDWKLTARGTWKEINGFTEEKITIPKTEVYEDMHKYYFNNPSSFVQLGKAYHTFDKIFLHEGDIYAKIRIDAEIENREYIHHPLISNSIFLTILPQLKLNEDHEGFLPFGIGSLTVKKGIVDKECWIKVRLLKNNEELILFDAEVFSESGEVAAIYKKCALKRLRNKDLFENKIYLPSIVDSIQVYVSSKIGRRDLEVKDQESLKKINVFDFLSQLELDSLIKSISDEINIELSSQLFLEYNTLDKFSNYLYEVHGNEFSKFLKEEKEENPKIVKFETIKSQSLSTDYIEEYLQIKLQQVTKKDKKFNKKNNLMDIGLSSAQLINLTNIIENEVGIKLEATLLFEYPNILELSKYFFQENFNAFSKLIGVKHERLEQKAIPKKQFSHQFKESYKENTINDVNEDDIAIIGMHGRFANSENLEEFWNHLVNQTDLMSEIPIDHWDYRPWFTASQEKDKIYSKWGSFINNVAEFDAEFFNISPREAEWIDPQLRLLLQSIYHTAENAGYANKFKGTNTGVFVGACFHDYLDKIAELNLPVDPYVGTGNVQTVLANRVSFTYNLNGPSISVDTACSSSLVALHQACQAIKNNECKMAFVGGVNLLLSSWHYRYFCSIGALSPSGRCHTFDAKADGYTPGECVASILIKPLKEALKDGDTIHAIVKGTASLHGGYTPSLTAPSVSGEENVIVKAWEASGISPQTISYIEAHGTGTKLGDPIEVKALKKAFYKYTDEEEFCTIGSAKGNIGHAEGAAGIAGLIKVVLQMKNKTIPALPALENINPMLELKNSALRINKKNEFWKVPNGTPRRAGISSFGFSGAYAHTIIEEYNLGENELLESYNPVCIILSARGKDQLVKKIENLYQYLKTHKEISLYDIAYTLQEGREQMEFRTGFVSSSIPETIQYLDELLKEFNEDSYALITDEIFNIETPINYPLDQLLKKWSDGATIEWKSLYKSNPRIIGLPGYPFQRKKYWIKEAITINDESVSMRDTNLLKPIGDNEFKLIFQKEDFFISDHKVNGKACVPAVMFVDLILRSLDGLGDVELEEIIWIKPITEDLIGTDLRIKIEDTTVRGSQKFVFKDIENTIFCKGSIFIGSSKLELPLDMSNSTEEAFKGVPKWDKNSIYNFFNTSGLNYGSTHQGLHEVFIDDEKIKAIIKLPKELKNTKNNFKLHPGIADPILQATVILLNQHRIFDPKKHKTPMPYSVLKISGNTYLPEVVEVELSIHSKTQNASGLSPEINIYVFDENKKLLMIWLGLRVYILEKSEEKINWKTISFEEKKEDIKEPVLDFQSRVIVGIDCSSILNNVKKKFPEIDIFKITTNECLSANFSQVALELFQILKEKYEVNVEGETIFQIVTLTSEEAHLILSLSGLLKTVHQENPDYYFQILILEESSQLEQINYSDVRSHGVEIIEYRNGKQFQEKIINLPELALDNQKVWKKNGGYLITGGSGEIAKLLVENILIQEPQASIFLVGRRPKDRVSWLNNWIQKGYNVVYFSDDLANLDSLSAILNNILNTCGKINGVIHAAGITKDNFLINKTEKEFIDVLKPKVSGINMLDKALEHVQIDFLCLFSSISGAFGNIGQADYAVANSYLNRFAQHRNQKVLEGLKFGNTISINWPLWKEGGINVSEKIEALIESRFGIPALQTNIAMTILEKAIQSKESILIPVFNGDEKKIKRIEADINNEQIVIKQPFMQNENNDIKQETILYFKELMADILKLEALEIDEKSSMEKYGIDSIMIMELNRKLESVYGKLPKTLFFEYKRIWELVDYFIEKHPDKTRSLIGIENKKIENKSVDLGSDIGIQSEKNSAFESLEREKSLSSDIAIIGISGKYPKAENLEQFWGNLLQGRDCISEIPEDRWNHSKYYDSQKGIKGKTYSKWGGFMDDVDCFDPLFFGITPLEAEYMDPQERLFLECAYSTLEDAGYTRERLKSDLDFEAGPNIGVFAGVMYEEYQLYGAQLSQEGEVRALGGSPASIANRVSHYFDFHGPSMAVDTMCSSALTAIDLACKSLLNEDCEAALAGAVNTSLHPNKYIMLAQGNFVSSKGKCESFGIGGEGYVPGEGVGIVMLKKLDKAIDAGDQIYGVIKSSVINHGGRTNGYTVPNPQAQASVIKRAIKKAGVTPNDISYVEAHGTGTALGDPIEIAGLNRAFQDRTMPCPIGSVKSNIGHCESAAGISGLTKIILQLKHKKLVPSLHSAILNPNIDFSDTFFYVQQDEQDWLNPTKEINGETIEIPRIAAISSFGAGGANAHMIIQEYIKPSSVLTELDDYPILISAKTKEQLTKKASELLAFVQKEKEKIRLTDIAFTLQIGKEAMKYKVGFIANSLTVLITKLIDIVEGNVVEDLWYNKTNVKREVMHSQEEINDTFQKAHSPKQIISYWLEGRTINWASLRFNQSAAIISLPTYPFAKEKYWPNLDILNKEGAGSFNDNIMETVWVQKKWEEETITIPYNSENALSNVLIITTQETYKIAATINKKVENGEIIQIEKLKDISEGKLHNIKVIIDLTPLSNKENIEIEIIPFLQRIISLNHSLLSVLGVFSESITNGGNLMALYKSLGLEYSKVESRYLLFVDKDMQIETQVKWILKELNSTFKTTEIKIDSEKKHLPVIKEVTPFFSSATPFFDPNKVVWITGGTRGIGFTCAKYLVEKYNVKKVVLTGKTQFPPRKEWDEIEDPNWIEKISKIKKLEQKGITVHVNATNLSDPEAMRKEVKYINSSLGAIGIVIHAAGIADLETPAFIKKESNTVKKVLQPKVEGARILLEAISDQPIEKVIMFSSVSALIPSLAVGQIDYAMANSNLDLIAEQHDYSFDIISVQWPNWKDSGMGEVKSVAYQSTGLKSLSDQEGLFLLDNILRLSGSQVIMPAIIEKENWKPELLLNIPKERQATIISVSEKKQNLLFSEDKNTKNSSIEEWLVNLFSSELRIPKDRLEKDMDFSDFGVDSIILTQLMRSVNKYLEIEIDPSIFYEYTNINKLVLWVYENHKDKFDKNQEKENQKPTNTDNVNIVEEKEEFISSKSNANSEYAIIGMSCRFPDSKNIQEFWNLLSEGKSAIKKIPYDRWGIKNAGYAALLGSIEEFDILHFLITQEDAVSMDPQALLILEETLHLIYQSGYSEEEIKKTNTGVYIGARSRHIPKEDELLKSKNPILSLGQNYLAANVSQYFDFQGPSLVVDTACSSALTAIDIACKDLNSGDVNKAIVGGVTILQTPEAHKVFKQRGLLNETGEFHVFDKRANGVILGEGIGMIMIKRLEDALKDGDKIEAVISGIAINNDGRTSGHASPNFEAQRAIMQKALSKGGIKKEEISHIETNGSGTELTDLLELKAIKSIYPTSSSVTRSLGSIKPNIGHPLCAEGIAGLIKLTLMLKNKSKVPFISGYESMKHFDIKKEGYQLDRKLQPWEGENLKGALNCFADGGTNAHLILRSVERDELKFQRRKEEIPPKLISNNIKKNKTISEKSTIESLNKSELKVRNFWKEKAYL